MVPCFHSRFKLADGQLYFSSTLAMDVVGVHSFHAATRLTGTPHHTQLRPCGYQFCNTSHGGWCGMFERTTPPNGAFRFIRTTPNFQRYLLIRHLKDSDVPSQNANAFLSMMLDNLVLSGSSSQSLCRNSIKRKGKWKSFSLWMSRYLQIIG